MSASLWNRCCDILRSELAEDTYNTWISPLQVIEKNGEIRLLAPNQYVVGGLEQDTLPRIRQIMDGLADRDGDSPAPRVWLEVGSLEQPPDSPRPKGPRVSNGNSLPKPPGEGDERADPTGAPQGNRINRKFTFDNFVEGKSNEFARAAAMQAAENPGDAFNPLFIYGGVGLGKTHLMQAVGNQIKAQDPGAQVLYVHSERFVSDMVRALQHNAINDFNRIYRSPNALLIDDVQFFARKDRSQEEFFHTFNSLIERQQQIVLTCDRSPKEVEGLEERLKSRFGWGITVFIDSPELETSVAILKRKAMAMGVALRDDVAFFTAELIRSNVRELEGGLHRLIAGAQFAGKTITIDFAREVFRDIIQLRERQVTIDNIKKTVAEYFKIRVSDLLSKSRRRSITRPRQMAMALAKELTKHSLPEIGEAFGGRDHTTVLHAVKKVGELRGEDSRVDEDYINLLRTLAG